MLNQWTSREKKLIAVILLLLLLWGGTAFSLWQSKQQRTYAPLEWEFSSPQESMGEGEQVEEQLTSSVEDEPTENQSQQNQSSQPQIILVDLKGEVRNPYVYEMVEGDRVIDVIQKAGGLNEGAVTQQINLAQKLTDGMVIYIPSADEIEEGSLVSETWVQDEGTRPEQEEETLININTASAAQLERLAGIGPSRAESIIRYREEHGPFVQKEDLMKVSGIGVKIFEGLKDEISI